MRVLLRPQEIYCYLGWMDDLLMPLKPGFLLQQKQVICSNDLAMSLIWNVGKWYKIEDPNKTGS